jgi:hypothetical protein
MTCFAITINTKINEVVKKHEQLLKQLGEKDRVFSLEWNEEDITLDGMLCTIVHGHDLPQRRVARIIGSIPRSSRKAGELRTAETNIRIDEKSPEKYKGPHDRLGCYFTIKE